MVKLCWEDFRPAIPVPGSKCVSNFGPVTRKPSERITRSSLIINIISNIVCQSCCTATRGGESFVEQLCALVCSQWFDHWIVGIPSVLGTSLHCCLVRCMNLTFPCQCCMMRLSKIWWGYIKTEFWCLVYLVNSAVVVVVVVVAVVVDIVVNLWPACNCTFRNC